MLPSQLLIGVPQRPRLRLALAVLGIFVLGWVASRVDWNQLGSLIASLRWPWVYAGLLLGCCSMSVRALRLKWILGNRAPYNGVWRATAWGYLGKSLLPMGGGEVVKIRALHLILERPTISVATGAILDRVFDLLGIIPLFILVAGNGLSHHLQNRVMLLGALGPIALVSALVYAIIQRRRGRERDIRDLSLKDSWLERGLKRIDEVLFSLLRPSHIGCLLAVQLLVSVLDLGVIYLGLRAFPFGDALPGSVSANLAIYLMLGTALPLLPGGAGTLQVGCILALQPYGVSAAGGFAYALLSQSMGFALSGFFGVMAAFWPGKGAVAGGGGEQEPKHL